MAREPDVALLHLARLLFS